MVLLFPSRYRAIGVCVALAGLLGYCVASTGGLINVYRVISSGNTFPDGSYPYPSDFREVNAVFGNASLCFLVLGIIAVFMAREPDEYCYKIRLESIQFAASAQFLTGLAAFAYFYFTPGYRIENTFQAIIGLACGTFLLAYALRYYAVIYIKPGQD